MMSSIDWDERTLGDIGETLIGLTYSPSQVGINGDLVLRSSNIQNGALDLRDTVRVTADVPARIRVKRSDILICVRNGSRSLIGKSLLLDQRVEGETFGAFMAVFRSPLNEYLSFFFQSNDFKRQVDEHLGATINQITNRSLKSFRVLIPRAADRARITTALADVSEFIQLLESLVAKKQAIKQGVLQQLLTGKTRLPGFTTDWQESTVSEAANVLGGGTPSTWVAAYWRGLIPWFTPAEIRARGAGLVSVSERMITRDGLAHSGAHLLPVGSVLVTSRASIGHCAVAEVPVCTNQGFTSLVPHDSRSTWFLYYWVQQNKPELQLRAAGSTFLEVSARKVAAIPIVLPSLEEQSVIGNALRDADIELDSLERRLDSTRRIKQGMMQELLTGRTRLVNAEVSS